MNPIKPWYHSKTIWFNIIIAALTALEAVAGLLQPLVPGNIYAYGMVLLTVGNAVLRIISAQALTFSNTAK